MLPAYMVLCGVMAFFYLFDPNDALSKAPAYEIQREYPGLWFWGLIMLSITGLMVAALLIHNRIAFAYALSCCALTWVIWGGTYALAAASSDRVTLLAPVLPLFVATACVASLVSLMSREV